RLQPRLERALARLGLSRAPHETPRALARRVRERLGEAGAEVEAQLLALEALRYGPGATTDARALRQWQRGFERAVAATVAAGGTSCAGTPATWAAGSPGGPEAPVRSR
uniref:DUF4129 domain-containing protein n=1 Tax=uncultured Azohydromonas sp. TaxID=487342 RepID=UPI00262F2273